MDPLRAGFVYGAVAVVIALVENLRFLLIDPEGMPDWILTSIETYHTQLALAAYFFLGILATLRVRPTRLDPDASYRALLVRDCALAATVVAVVVGVTLFVLTAFNATLFAGEIRAYAREASPSILAYNEKVAGRLDDPPPLPTVEEIEEDLQPPGLNDLGRSMANTVPRALLLGAVGAAIGALRGSSGSDLEGQSVPPAGKRPER